MLATDSNLRVDLFLLTVASQNWTRQLWKKNVNRYKNLFGIFDDTRELKIPVKKEFVQAKAEKLSRKKKYVNSYKKRILIISVIFIFNLFEYVTHCKKMQQNCKQKFGKKLTMTIIPHMKNYSEKIALPESFVEN